MRHFKTKKGVFKQQLKKWGDLVTFDFLRQLGVKTDTNVFVARDIYSGVRMAHPTSDGSAEKVVSG